MTRLRDKLIQEMTFAFVDRSINSQKYYILRLYGDGVVQSAYGRMRHGDEASCLSDNQKSTAWHEEYTGDIESGKKFFHKKANEKLKKGYEMTFERSDLELRDGTYQPGTQIKD